MAIFFTFPLSTVKFIELKVIFCPDIEAVAGIIVQESTSTI